MSSPPSSILVQISATMGNLRALFPALIMLVVMNQGLIVHANFNKSTVFNWGHANSAIWGNGTNLALVLNQVSGSGIQTKKQFLFGSIEMHIKLVSGNSAGTVTAYYVTLLLVTSPLSLLQMSSTGDRHDEIDFEFLGNVSGQPYIIHTNVFTQGVGNREQQFYPWFDPTADFHNYTIHWNPSHIVWFIDGLPIRVFGNHESIGIPYPNRQGMRAYSSIWNADNWATRGGLEKINWSGAPFVARYRNIRLRACKWNGPSSIGSCAAGSLANWWSSPNYSKLSYAQMGQLAWVRNNHMIYDYCKDTKRFNGKIPLECYQQPF